MQPAETSRTKASLAAKHVATIVESARGSRIKYKYDEGTRRFTLSKILPEGMVFPYDFGFFPDTKSPDGDPLDVLILNDEPTFPGCEIDCRIIGVIQAMQTERGERKRNDRLIAANASIQFAELKEISDLPSALLKQLLEFFVNYQKARDIGFEVLSVEGSHAARKQLEAASV
jgi:inorganic pyrophosphatase